MTAREATYISCEAWAGRANEQGYLLDGSTQYAPAAISGAWDKVFCGAHSEVCWFSVPATC